MLLNIIDSDDESSPSVEERCENQCPHISFRTNEEIEGESVEIEGDDDDGLSNVCSNKENELSSERDGGTYKNLRIFKHAPLKVKKVNLFSLKCVKFLII